MFHLPCAPFAPQMLLDFPKTDINLKSDGGISPLMDAVKSTNMYMVKQLVKKSADISLTDYEGMYVYTACVCIIGVLCTFCFKVCVPAYDLANSLKNALSLPHISSPPPRSHGGPLGSHDGACGGTEAPHPPGSRHNQGRSG